MITGTTPQAYTEWSLLISLSGSSDGIAAITGLVSTSQRPLEAAKIIVPTTRPTYAVEGDKSGHRANMSSPENVRTGINLIDFLILNL